MLELKLLEREQIEQFATTAKALPLGAGTEFLSAGNRKPVDDHNDAVAKNAAELMQVVASEEITLAQLRGISIGKLRTLRDDRQQRLLALLQQRVKLAESRRSIIESMAGLPEAALEAAHQEFEKVWQSTEKTLRKAGANDQVPAVFAGQVRTMVPVREAQLAKDDAWRHLQSFIQLRQSPDEAGELASNDLLQFVKSMIL